MESAKGARIAELERDNAQLRAALRTMHNWLGGGPTVDDLVRRALRTDTRREV